MGLHKTAHYLKSKGRGTDTELVHMSPNEVEALKGLAAKHGGSLTTNPETGLPEAGFLSSILPAVAGIGLDVLTDGAMTPLLSGMLVGGADYAMTGSLTKGLMAGMGAYGGADLTNAFAGAGASLAPAGDVTAESEANPANWGSEDTTGKAVLNTPPPASRGANALTGLTGPTAMSTFGSHPGAAMMAFAPVLTDSMSSKSTIPTAATGNTNPFGFTPLSKNFQGYAPAQPNPYYKPQYTDYRVGMAAGGSVPSYSGDSDYGSVVNATNILENYASQRPIISTAQPSLSVSQDTDPNTKNLDAYSAALYRLGQKAKAAGMGKNAVSKGLKPVVNLGQINNEDADTQDYAIGGAVEQMSQQNANNGVNNYYPQGLQEHTQFATPTQLPTSASIVNSDYDPKTNAYTGEPMQQFAGGGNVVGLGGYAAGGNPHLLKGPGDGMSDSIPANIGGKQPARLADGEFVVPADVVSHLGNGSTDAGAKRLYAMMDKIRQARTGRKKQAPAVKVDKYLPK